MEQREERPSLLGLSRVVTEEDEVNPPEVREEAKPTTEHKVG